MKKILILLAFMASLFGADATIEVVNRGASLPKIMIQDATLNFASDDIKERFLRMIKGDLKVGSAFEVIQEHENTTMDSPLTSAQITATSPQFVLRYALSGGIDYLNLHVKLLNVSDGAVRFEANYSQKDVAKWPFISHRAVADIARSLNLSPIEWMDKSILISQYTSPGTSRIIIADYTLTYQNVILSGGLNIFPKWANAEQSAFYYTSYVKGKPTLFRYDLASGKKMSIISSQGMVVASDVSADGQKLLLTMAPEDQSDIFLYDLKTRSTTKITNYSGIDVNGNFIENDTRVVFVSDRMGAPNIFATDLNGRAVEQLVYHGKNNNSISTWQNYIVYSSRESNSEFAQKTFNLYLISTKSDYIRQLTATGINTSPRFSSDGGSIVYIKHSGAQSALGIIRVNENKSFAFALNIGKLQAIDW